ncbi:hypothetical protein ASE63_26025, partial [Bosea sp. Root381]|uniref:hypothetical protein n=1 Tax=Bosea sp. Root381 TaxID=1736524 RepID=UPI0006F3560F
MAGTAMLGTKLLQDGRRGLDDRTEPRIRPMLQAFDVALAFSREAQADASALWLWLLGFFPGGFGFWTQKRPCGLRRGVF